VANNTAKSSPYAAVLAARYTLDCLSFKPITKNTLRGFAKVRINELGLVIGDVTLHQKNTSRWASLPAKPQMHDGALVSDPHTGRLAYVAVLEFETREARDIFSMAVWNAVAKVAVLEDVVA
jgi:hypothetical protein